MKKLFFILMTGALAGLLSSCSLFGLDLQKDAEYNYSPVQLTMDITAYEFIETRRNMDMFLLYKAIEKAGYRDAFETDDRTYILLNDDALTAYLSGKRFASLDVMSVTQVREMLDTYIVKGRYHALDLSTTPIEVETLNPEKRMFLSLRPQASDVSDQYQVIINNVTGSGKVTNVVTSNLQPTNGIIHVVGDFPEYIVSE
ncbi:hypothetical protein GPL06_02775 [Bacteroides salyersiae]|uniref:fasciclin domain-containing protein n=1 Tax=Bacteroides salyersiae TaxID=291644 RepID=UPI001C0245E8|nr:fasciclin domain-containing protein [Bacteroides salyersiae]MBT9871761.1 hypothetical protein [Bacteroides salyersiae]